MIIDFHTHIFPPRVIAHRDEYVSRDSCFAGLYASPKAMMITAEELVAAMDGVGVDVSVALNIGWTSHELCRETNDYLLEAAARFPKRIAAFCAILPQAGPEAVNELERCFRGGALGIGEMRPDVQQFDPGDRPLMAPLVEVMVRHGLIFLTHSSEPVGHSYPGKGAVTPDILYRFVSAFPDLKVVCAHWGGGLPFYAMMPEVGRALANVWFDSAATPFLYRPRIFKQVAGLVGNGKVLFGSDYPLLPQRRIMAEIEGSGLEAEAAGAILGGNAAELLGLSHSTSDVSGTSPD